MLESADNGPDEHKTGGFVLKRSGKEQSEHENDESVLEWSREERSEHKNDKSVLKWSCEDRFEHKTGKTVPEPEEESRSSWMRALNLSAMGLRESCQ